MGAENWIVSKTKKKINKKNGFDVMVFYPVSRCISLLAHVGTASSGDESY